MPAYTFECECGRTFEVVRSVKDFRRTALCDCGSTAQLVITAPAFGFVQRECRYDSPVDGRPITSWAARRDDLARHGCQEYDPEMRKDAERFRREADEKLDRAVSETVEREIEKMPSAKRERLHNELASGVTAEVERL